MPGGHLGRAVARRSRRVELAGLGPLLEVAAEPAADHLVDATRRRPPRPLGQAADDEPAVLALAGQPVLEDDHRGDHVGVLQVRHVVALDPQRRLVAGRAPPGSPPAPGCALVRSLPRLVLCSASACAALRATVSIRARLSPRCGTRRSTLLPRSPLSQCPTASASGGSAGTRTSRGTLSPHVSDGLVGGRAVDLLEEVLDEVAGGDVLDLVDDPAALAADPAAADVEDLHRRLERVLGEGDDVGVGAVAEHDRLLLHRALERLDVVAQPGRPLVLLVGRGDLHVLLEAAQERRGLAGHEVAEVVDDLRGAPSASTRPTHGRRALADVAEQARPADLAGPLEHPGRAGPGREHPQQQVERLADRPGVRVRPEVAHALLLRAAHHLQPRELLVERDREARVALVVAVADVEPRVELLDPGVLELQRLDLGRDDRPLDAGRGGDHRLGARRAGRRCPGSTRTAAGAGCGPCRRR